MRTREDQLKYDPIDPSLSQGSAPLKGVSLLGHRGMPLSGGPSAVLTGTRDKALRAYITRLLRNVAMSHIGAASVDNNSTLK